MTDSRSRALRTTLTAASAALIIGLTGCAPNSAQREPAQEPSETTTPADQINDEIRALEEKYDAHIGVAAHNLDTDAVVAHRADERFGFASTNKSMIVLALLASTVDADLEKVIHYDEDDLLDYAPVTREHLDTGMTVRNLAKAAIGMSDNTAANLVMDEVGGPSGVEEYLRSLGDDTTSVDRTEPTLNDVAPGETHDTTTPATTVTNLAAIVKHDGVDGADSEQLLEWMRGNTTGDEKIRAGVPHGWSVADKTGSASGFDISNDIAVVWNEADEPIVIAVYTRQQTEAGTSPDSLIAEVAEAVVAQLN